MLHAVVQAALASNEESKDIAAVVVPPSSYNVHLVLPRSVRDGQTFDPVLPAGSRNMVALPDLDVVSVNVSCPARVEASGVCLGATTETEALQPIVQALEPYFHGVFSLTALFLLLRCCLMRVCHDLPRHWLLNCEYSCMAFFLCGVFTMCSGRHRVVAVSCGC